MRIMNNISAMNSHRLYTANNNKLSKSLEKLSSGYAINRAGDNAAGLAVSEKMRAQIAGLEQASKNAQDGISMVQTYEGALTETDSILQRMRSLAVQSANGTYDNSVDRVAIEQEFKQLNDELNQIADTDFNGVIVLNGGTMADGTKAVGGVIDYTDTTSKRDAVELSAADFNVGEAKGNATATETVKFTYTDDGDGTGTWAQVGGAGTFANKDTGGFTYDGYVFSIDTSKLVSGDYVTVDFTKGSTAVSVAAKNGGYTYDGFKADPLGAVTPGTYAPQSEAAAEAINKLQGATINLTTDGTGAVQAIGTTGATTLTLADGTKVTNAACSATNPYQCTVGANGAIAIKGWVDGAEQTLFEIAAGTAAADNASTNGSITLAFADAVYTPANAGGYEIQGKSAAVSKSNALDQSTTKLTYVDGMSLQVGARTKDLVDFTFNYSADGIGELKADLNCTAKGLGTDELSLATQESANAAIDKIDHAINKVSMVRGTFGAIQNRLEHKISNLDTNNENLTAAESRIRDTDMAAEMMEFTKNQILSQASQSMLAQANQLPQGVLSLLQ